MTFVFISLLLVSWLTLGTCQDVDLFDALDDDDVVDSYVPKVKPTERVPVSPNIKVFQQVDDRDNVIVMCTTESGNAMSSCELSVKTEHNYTLDKIQNQRDFHLFVVTASPPVSFTCMCKTQLITYSETYNFNQSGKLNIQDPKDSGPSIKLMTMDG